MPETGIYKRGKTWTYYVEHPRDPLTGRRRQESKGGFPTAKAAAAARRARLLELDRGEAGRPGRLTLSELLTRWLAHEEPGWREQTTEAYRTVIRKHLGPALGSVRLSTLTPYLIEEYYRTKRSALSGRTLQQHHAILRQALARAVRWGLLPRSPMEQVDCPSATRRVFPHPTPAQVRTLLDTTTGHWLRLAVLLAAAGGLRRGEALGLRWSDLDGEQVTVRRSLNRGGKVGPPKGGRERTFTLPAFAVAELEQARQEQVAYRAALGAPWSSALPIVADREGRPVSPGALQWQYEKALKAAGLPHFRFHDNRHGNASWLLGSGEQVKVVQERLGHASPSTTMQVYAHVLPGADRTAAGRLDDLLRG